MQRIGVAHQMIQAAENVTFSTLDAESSACALWPQHSDSRAKGSRTGQYGVPYGEQGDDKKWDRQQIPISKSG